MLDDFLFVEMVCLILFWYCDFDVVCEGVVSDKVKIGMIKCGIGFVYEDKVGCCVICVVDFVDEVVFD